jgi:hypothetical protein
MRALRRAQRYMVSAERRARAAGEKARERFELQQAAAAARLEENTVSSFAANL